MIDDILITAGGEIWLATMGNGFCRFDPEKQQIVEVYADDKAEAYDRLVISLTQLNDTIIIGVCTYSKGFLLFNRRQKNISTYTVKNGLPINEVWSIAYDGGKNVWIATVNDLLQMNTDKQKFISFDEEDGLLNKHSHGKITVLKDGRMAIPTTTGIAYFTPGKIQALPSPPDVQITSVKVFDQSLPVDSILAVNSTVELNHQQNFITINYTSNSFLSRNSTRYFLPIGGC